MINNGYMNCRKRKPICQFIKINSYYKNEERKIKEFVEDVSNRNCYSFVYNNEIEITFKTSGLTKTVPMKSYLVYTFNYQEDKHDFESLSLEDFERMYEPITEMVK